MGGRKGWEENRWVERERRGAEDKGERKENGEIEGEGEQRFGRGDDRKR